MLYTKFKLKYRICNIDYMPHYPQCQLVFLSEVNNEMYLSKSSYNAPDE